MFFAMIENIWFERNKRISKGVEVEKIFGVSQCLSLVIFFEYIYIYL